MASLTLKDLREAYYALSGKASDIVRQLGLGGIALIWVFKTDRGGGEWVVPSGLILPGILIVIALGLDLLHYLAATAIWGIFNWKKQNEGIEEEATFSAPWWINWPAMALFWLKAAFMVCAYIGLLQYLTNLLPEG